MHVEQEIKKLTLECSKLDLEIRDLKKPFQRPAVVAQLGLLGIGLVGAVGGWINSSLSSRFERLRAERAIEDAKKEETEARRVIRVSQRAQNTAEARALEVRRAIDRIAVNAEEALQLLRNNETKKVEEKIKTIASQSPDPSPRIGSRELLSQGEGWRFTATWKAGKTTTKWLLRIETDDGELLDSRSLPVPKAMNQEQVKETVRDAQQLIRVMLEYVFEGPNPAEGLPQEELDRIIDVESKRLVLKSSLLQAMR